MFPTVVSSSPSPASRAGPPLSHYSLSSNRPTLIMYILNFEECFLPLSLPHPFQHLKQIPHHHTTVVIKSNHPNVFLKSVSYRRLFHALSSISSRATTVPHCLTTYRPTLMYILRSAFYRCLSSAIRHSTAWQQIDPPYCSFWRVFPTVVSSSPFPAFRVEPQLSPHCLKTQHLNKTLVRTNEMLHK